MHAQEGYCSWVYACLLSYITPLECLFVLTPSCTQQATEVKKFSLKQLRCIDPALPPLKAIRTAKGHEYLGAKGSALWYGFSRLLHKLISSVPFKMQVFFIFPM